MIDLSKFKEQMIAPRAVFEQLAERSTRPRFMIQKPGSTDWHAITWGAHAAEISNVASFLLACGMKRGDRAAVFAPNRVEWMSAALGIQAAGGVMVPIYPASTAAQAAYVASHSDARFVFVDTAMLLRRIFEGWSSYGLVERIVLLDDALDAAAVLAELRSQGKEAPSLADVEARVVTWSRAVQIGAARAAEKPGEVDERMKSVSLEDNAIMLYTSGTTGNPKGVPLTHQNVAANGSDWLEVNASLLDEDAVDLLWLPMSHIFGLGQACLGNTLGFLTYLAEPHKVLDLLPVVRPRVFMSVPAYWEKLAQKAMEAPDRDARRAKLAEVTGGKLRFCLSGGAGLKREVKELFYDCGLLIIEGYGLTECSPTLTMNRPNAFRFDSVGKPFPSVELKLAEDGEILAKGPGVFKGYHKEPDATRDVFTDDGWFKTGDVGRFTEDGFLQIIDRKKEILVTAGGKNVPPQNIEIRFRDVPFIDHALVYGDGKKFLVLGVWLNHEALDARIAERGLTGARGETAKAWVAEAVAKVNEELASFEQVKRFRIMDTPLTVASGLLTSTLKMRRKKIYEAFRGEFESLYEP
ncbi:MAG: AMP-dependent synthetase/ligase [Polyangiaceae bacterium]